MNSPEIFVIHLFMSIGLFYNHVVHEKMFMECIKQVRTMIMFLVISIKKDWHLLTETEKKSGVSRCLR